jgi:hypothetical protein
MTFAMVVIAFVLGVWVGAGWFAHENRKWKRMYEKLYQATSRIVALVNKAVQK